MKEEKTKRATTVKIVNLIDAPEKDIEKELNKEEI